MDISIVLEWENAVLSELTRTRRLLQEIFIQTQPREEEFELLVLHNERQVKKKFILGFIEQVISENDLRPRVPISVVDVEDAHYFQLKNKGVELAKGEKIIFFDSDIIPHSGWMDKVLEAHVQHPDSIVSGSSYIDYTDLTGKAFALSWFFPLLPTTSELKEVSMIFSNNYLAPREMMLSNPYPQMEEGVTRGADTLLWERLRQNGIKLFTHTGARASHPAPNGLQHIVKRGLAEGRDDYLKLFEKEFAAEKPFFRIVWIYLARLRKTFKSTLVHRRRVGLKGYQVPSALGLMFFYYQLFLLGALTTLLLPSVAKSSWRI